MKLHFLGTAASEGYPAVFCRCEACQKAKSAGGKNIRTRAGAIVDDTLEIDFGPDTYMQALRDGIDLGRIEHLFITHTHSDHLVVDELNMRLEPFAWKIPGELRVYGHDKAIYKIHQAVHDPSGEFFSYTLMQPFQTVEAGQTRVTAIRADHDPKETCLLYLFEKDRKRLLWGHDSGYFPEESWEWLEMDVKENGMLALVVLDCTNGPLPGMKGHMGIEGAILVKQTLLKKGIIDDSATVVANHFSHNGNLLHDELEQQLNPHGIMVAYDGLVVDF